MKLQYLLLTLITLMSVFAEAQTITSMITIPANPTVNDSIKVVANTSFSSSPCSLVSSGVLFGSPIIINSVYCKDALTAICDRSDTFDLGKLQPGMDTIRFQLSIPTPNSACGNPPPWTLVAAKTIFIQITTGIDDAMARGETFTIYPNPSHNDLYIEHSLKNAEKAEIMIYDLQGKVVKTIPLSEASGISLKTLAPGSYFLQMVHPDYTTQSKKLIVVK